jgi:hypothetical protein
MRLRRGEDLITEFCIRGFDFRVVCPPICLERVGRVRPGHMGDRELSRISTRFRGVVSFARLVVLTKQAGVRRILVVKAMP